MDYNIGTGSPVLKLKIMNYPNGAGLMDYEDVDPDFVYQQKKKQLFIKRFTNYKKNAISPTP